VERGSAWEGLSVLVDGLAVKSAVVAGFAEGVIAYWPPNVDEAVLELFNNLYLQAPRLAYVIIYLSALDRTFLAIVYDERVLALEIDRRVNARRMGEKLLKIFEELRRAKALWSS
jgi:hypothetical protein